MDRLIKTIGAIMAIMALSGFGSIERLFAPNSDPWPRWEIHNPESRQIVDHSEWNAILTEHVQVNSQGPNRLNYGAFSTEDRKLLDDYIAGLAEIPITGFHRNEQMAYWINLYNALTVQVVLAHFPVDSIRDIKISPGLFAIGPWGRQLVTVEGQELSLNDIEHRILRPIWRDPRVHYAVNCASIGCPNLDHRAYSADTLNTRLEQAARDYVNSPRGVSIVGGKVSVSKIYDWFVDDFGGNEKSVLRHLLQYANPELAGQLEAIGKLSDEHYDWGINNIN